MGKNTRLAQKRKKNVMSSCNDMQVCRRCGSSVTEDLNYKKTRHLSSFVLQGLQNMKDQGQQSAKHVSAAVREQELQDLAFGNELPPLLSTAAVMSSDNSPGAEHKSRQRLPSLLAYCLPCRSSALHTELRPSAGRGSRASS